LAVVAWVFQKIAGYPYSRFYYGDLPVAVFVSSTFRNIFFSFGLIPSYFHLLSKDYLKIDQGRLIDVREVIATRSSML
jgi:hypothetical protein